MIAFSVFLVAAVAAAAYLFHVAQSFDSKSEKIESAFPAEASRPQKAQPANGAQTAVNILVMGSDSRTANQLDAENAVATDQRADTLMIIHIPSDRKKVYAMSLMRDLWVQIPGHGEAKINAALALGGVPLMVETVESIFSQRIDHVAMIDFEGFKDLTNALGGVDVRVTVPFTSTHGGFTFSRGVNAMNGEQALGFVRERYSFTDGDYQRVRNQQSFVKAILAKMIDAQTLSNPARVANVVSAIAPYISVDKGLNAQTVAALGVQLNGVRQNDIRMFTLPTRGTGKSADGQSIVLVDSVAVEDVSSALAKDELEAYLVDAELQDGN